MNRFSRQILILVIVAAVMAMVSLALLVSGILTALLTLIPYLVTVLVISLAVLLAMIPTILWVKYHCAEWPLLSAFGVPVVVGAVGVLFTAIIVFFISPIFLIAIDFIIAINFFFLVLMLGGLVLLLVNYIRLHMKRCACGEPQEPPVCCMREE